MFAAFLQRSLCLAGKSLRAHLWAALNIANRKVYNAHSRGLQSPFSALIRIYHGSGLSAYGGNPLQAIQVTFVTIPMEPEAIANCEKQQLSRPAHLAGRDHGVLQSIARLDGCNVGNGAINLAEILRPGEPDRIGS